MEAPDDTVGVEEVEVKVVVVVVVVVGCVGAEVSSGRVSAGGSVGAVDVSAILVGAVPPRRGESSSKVVVGGRLSDEIVSEGDRWRPARTSRTLDGKLAEADRKSRTSEMEFEGRTFRGIAIYTIALSGAVSQCVGEVMGDVLHFPPPILTKIWTLSAGSDEADEVEDERERMVEVVLSGGEELR